MTPQNKRMKQTNKRGQCLNFMHNSFFCVFPSTTVSNISSLSPITEPALRDRRNTHLQSVGVSGSDAAPTQNSRKNDDAGDNRLLEDLQRLVAYIKACQLPREVKLTHSYSWTQPQCIRVCCQSWWIKPSLFSWHAAQVETEWQQKATFCAFERKV